MHRLSLAALVVALVAVGAAPVQAQTGLWSDISEVSLSKAGRVTVPQAYRTVRLDAPQMRQRLAAAPAEAQVGKASGGTGLSIPLPEGGSVEVRVVESSILAPALQAKYPEIQTYLASGPGSVHGRLSYTPAGFRGMLFAPGGTIYIDPYSPGETQTYIVYRAQDLVVDPILRGRVEDRVEGETLMRPLRSPEARPHGEQLRTYRLAVAATGEYTSFHGGTKAGAMAAITTTMNRVTGIYERDLAVRFQLVANNDQVVFTNAATDPFSNTSSDLTANITTLNTLIGSANYDVGHLVGTGGGGVAYLGVICSSSKGGGLTGSSQPVGDAFDVDYVAHEIGHQFGGNHTFNGDSGSCSGGNRNGSTAYEPGSGSTIQAYAGICGNDNLQSNSDPYFHGISLDEMSTHVTTGSGGTCGTVTNTGNTIPTVTASGGFTIPAGTPFTLTGSATDDTPGSLTYTWEEFDLGPQADVGAGTVPFFRSFEPTASPSRTFPQMSRLLAGQPPVIGETLPTGTRTMTFRLTARDNAPGAGAINDATISLDVDGSAGPFAVTFASASGQSYSGAVNVTWNVAGTASGAVNTPNVEILFSDNGGASFDYTLTPSTANDGAEVVTLPNVTTGQGRILIRGVGNVFFNVNPQPFSVTPGGDPAEIAVSPASVSETVAPEATTTATVTVSNTAASGAAVLSYGAAIQNATGSVARPEREGPLSAFARAVVSRASGAKGDDGARGPAPLAKAGGPDAFGYEYADSSEPGGPAVSFQDISASGTLVSWTAASTYAADDEGYADIALPFSFPFYGSDRTSVRVFTNGFLTFTALTGDTFTNGTIPAAATPNALIAPFWDDLDVGAGGSVYTGTLPDGRFVVQFTGVPRYGTSQGTTFQVLLDASGAIEFQYGTMNGNVGSATVGIESDGGSDGLQAIRNAAYLTSDMAIRFAVPSTWVTVAPASGSVQPGASADLTLSFDATDLAEGTYTADLVISSSDPSSPTVTVPVTLTVADEPTGTGPIVFTAPASGETLNAGTTYTVTWDPGGVAPGTEMILNLKSASEGNSTIARGVPNTGSYAWSIPATQGSASDYRIIGVYTDPASGAKVRPKTNPFAITGGVAPPTPITVTSPEAGDVLAAGTTTTITWDPGDIDPAVKLQIRLLASGYNLRIAKNEANDGVYTWDIPSDQAARADYRIQLVYTDPATGAKVKPKSDAFEIASASARPTKVEAVLALLPVQPNPTRGAATVPFSLAEAGDVRLTVHDVRGREVAVLASGRFDAGAHSATWASGEVSPGVYMVRLQAGADVLTQRAVVVR